MKRSQGSDIVQQNSRRIWDSKTIIIIFSVIISVVLFSTIISVISANLGRNIEKKQQDAFQSEVVKIKSDLKQNTVFNDFTILNKYVEKGYKITVSNAKGEFVYPFQTIINKELESNTKNPDVITINLKDGYIAQFEMQGFQFFISYPVQLKAPEITQIIVQSIPLLLVISFVVVAFVIFVYTRLYKKEKQKLDSLFQLMHKRIASDAINAQDFQLRIKDYIEIENQAKSLYGNLEKSQQQILKEMALVQELERTNLSLLQGITHEMKTPIMSTKLLISQLQQEPTNDKLVMSILQQVTNLEQLIKEILFVSQRKQLVVNPKPVLIEPILQRILENYDVLLEDKGLHIEKDIIADFHMRLDEKMIEKVLSNLLSNAIHYTTENATIKISIGENQFAMSNVFVEEKPINLKKIQQPFISFGNYGGTGLGLYIVKTILVDSPYELTLEMKGNEVFIAKINVIKSNPSSRKNT